MPDRSLTCSRAKASPIPAQPAWFHRLDEILSALRSMTSTHLDRAAVERLFGVRQRRARQIMAGLEGLRVGNAAGGVAGGSHRAPGADGLERREHELLRFRTSFAII